MTVTQLRQQYIFMPSHVRCLRGALAVAAAAVTGVAIFKGGRSTCVFQRCHRFMVTLLLTLLLTLDALAVHGAMLEQARGGQHLCHFHPHVQAV